MGNPIYGMSVSFVSSLFPCGKQEKKKGPALSGDEENNHSIFDSFSTRMPH